MPNQAAIAARTAIADRMRRCWRHSLFRLAFKAVVILLILLSPEIIYEIAGPTRFGDDLLPLVLVLIFLATLLWQTVRFIWYLGKALLTRQMHALHRGLRSVFAGGFVLLILFGNYWLQGAMLRIKVRTFDRFIACERAAAATAAGFATCELRITVGDIAQLVVFDRDGQLVKPAKDWSPEFEEAISNRSSPALRECPVSITPLGRHFYLVDACGRGEFLRPPDRLPSFPPTSIILPGTLTPNPYRGWHQHYIPPPQTTKGSD